MDGPWVYGYEGDPDNDGIYSYTYGYNLANSEMGHLFYTELGNLGYYDTSGDYQPGHGLRNTGDFDNLIASWYCSGTEYAANPDLAWDFGMHDGTQHLNHKNHGVEYGLAVRSGHVSAVPIPGGIYLLGSGLICLAGIGRRRQRNRR